VVGSDEQGTGRALPAFFSDASMTGLFRRWGGVNGLLAPRHRLELRQAPRDRRTRPGNIRPASRPALRRWRPTAVPRTTSFRIRTRVAQDDSRAGEAHRRGAAKKRHHGGARGPPVMIKKIHLPSNVRRGQPRPAGSMLEAGKRHPGASRQTSTPRLPGGPATPTAKSSRSCWSP